MTKMEEMLSRDLGIPHHASKLSSRLSNLKPKALIKFKNTGLSANTNQPNSSSRKNEELSDSNKPTDDHSFLMTANSK